MPDERIEEKIGEESAESNDAEAEHTYKTDTVPMFELRRVRQEAARYRKELQELRVKMDSISRESEQTKLSETERYQAKITEAEINAKDLRSKLETVSKIATIVDIATTYGFHSPRDAANLLDLKGIDLDSEGNVDEEQIKEMVIELAKSKPYLLKEQRETIKGNFGATNPPPIERPKPKLTSQNQIDRLKDEAARIRNSGRMDQAVKLYNKAWELEHGINKGG